MSMANDPAVSSVESDCYRQVDASLPKSGDSSPDLYEVARRLSVQADAPWGIDRIDTDGEPAVRSWRQQHHHRTAIAQLWLWPLAQLPPHATARLNSL